ncbi:hypothetical protein BDN70DRAFT_586815 [Pholiota conissans]|uniref:Uncharacterized protein n=1 Tax=Pholiota conissans TaxID=109636 RepID=A0A9P6CRM0_9AGAR|nr:hypothetical protein BDN70DRAFT_586815 [Pholiota conissans]
MDDSLGRHISPLIFLYPLTASLRQSLSFTAVQTYARPLPCDLLPRRRSRRPDRMYARLAICTFERPIRPRLCNSTLTSQLQRSYCTVAGLDVQCEDVDRCPATAMYFKRMPTIRPTPTTNANDGRLPCFNKQRGITPAHTKHHDAAAQKHYHTNDSTAYISFAHIQSHCSFSIELRN